MEWLSGTDLAVLDPNPNRLNVVKVGKIPVEVLTHFFRACLNNVVAGRGFTVFDEAFRPSIHADFVLRLRQVRVAMQVRERRE